MSKYIFFTIFIFSSVICFADTNIILSSSDTVQINDNVELIIKAEGEGSIAGAQIKITFDIQKLQIVDTSSLSGVSVGNIDNANTNGQITIAYIDMSGVGIDAKTKPVFSTLTFKAISEGATEVKLHHSSVISDSNMNNIAGIFTNATIIIGNGNDISGVRITLQSQEKVSLDNTFDVLVKASGTGLIAGAQIKIIFDPGVIQIQNTSLLIGASVGNIDNANTNGNITVVYLDMSGEGISADTSPTFATITFNPIKEDITDIDIDTSSVISDSEMKNILDTTEKATINIGNGNNISGVKIIVQSQEVISLENTFDVLLKASGTGLIAGAQIKIIFDPLILQIQKTSLSSSVSVGNIDNANTNGNISVVYLDMSGEGISAETSPSFATITFIPIIEDITDINIDTSSVISDPEMKNILDSVQNVTIKIGNGSTLTGVNIEIVAPDIVGSNSNFDIDIQANGQDLIAGAQIQINFDKNIIQLVNINPLSGVSFGSIEKANLNGNITLAYIDMSGTGIDANSYPVFATINCKALLDGTTDIEIDPTSVVSDSNMNNISGKFFNSIIDINSNNSDLGTIKGHLAFSIGGHNNLCVKNGEITLSGTITYTTTTNNDGDFILKNIESGQYTLFVTANNLNSITKNVVYHNNETLILDDLPLMTIKKCIGFYSQDEINKAVAAERQKWDVNGDNKKGIEEAINALQNISGIFNKCEGWNYFPFTGHYYKTISCPNNFHECRQLAISENADLVTINSEEENSWIVETFENIPYWIGFTDENKEGNWQWVTGEPVEFTNWYCSSTHCEPNNDGWTGPENYGFINYGESGKWNDVANGDYRYPFNSIIEKKICESKN